MATRRPRLAPIKVAFVSHVFWPERRRGGERLIRDLSDALIARGHEPSLITSHEAARSVTNEDGLRVIRQRRWPQRPFDGLGLPAGSSHAPAAWAALRRSDADVVQAWTVPAALAAARSGKASVFLFQGLLNEADLEGRPRVRQLLMKAARGCDIVTAYSEVAADEFTRITGVEARPIEPGIRLNAFAPASAAGRRSAPGSAAGRQSAPAAAGRQSAPSATGGRHATPAIFCAADPDEPRKRVGLLVEAFRQVRAKRSDTELWLMPARTIQAEDGIRFVDPGADGDALVELYRSAWVSVLPAFREAFGLVVVESLACGTPVIGMRDGGAVPAIIEGGTDGSVASAAQGPARGGIDGAAGGQAADPLVGHVAAPEPSALAHALFDAIAEPPDAALAAACRRRAEDFSIDRCAERYIALYDELLA